MMLFCVNLMARRFLLLGVLACLISASCSGPRADESGAIVVAAASDMAKIGPAIQVAFRRLHGYEVTFSFGASGQLAEQVRQGAPFDVYLSAARSYCEPLQQDGLLDGECRPYALGRLVAWSRDTAIQSLDDLRQNGNLRIVLANPRYAPYGLAAEQALRSAGIWDGIEPQLVYADSVSHAFQMAKTGNADVALVAIALVKEEGGNSLPVDAALHEPIEQVAAVLNSSAKKDIARAFVAYLSGPESRRLLETYGFGRP
jgi:molybdate transport system substrate-binding protein